MAKGTDVDFNQFTEAARQLGLYWLVLNEPAPLVRNQEKAATPSF